MLIGEGNGPFRLAVRRESRRFDGGDAAGVVRFEIHDIGLGGIVGQAVDVEVVDVEHIVVLLSAALEADGRKGHGVDLLLWDLTFLEKLRDIDGDLFDLACLPCVVVLLIQLIGFASSFEEGVGIDGAVGGREDKME